MPNQKRTVAILIFEGVELLDFAGPFEVFSAAKARPDNSDRLMSVFAVAETDDLITCRNGLVVKPEYTLETCPPFDILVVPGGQGTRTAINRPDLIDWIGQKSQVIELTTSVCTGSFLLAKAGILAGKAATTHWGSIQRLRDDFPDLAVREDARWVEVDNIISSAGVSAGIDMALHVVERLYGTEAAQATARGMEYDHWPASLPLG